MEWQFDIETNLPLLMKWHCSFVRVTAAGVATSMTTSLTMLEAHPEAAHARVTYTHTHIYTQMEIQSTSNNDPAMNEEWQQKKTNEKK